MKQVLLASIISFTLLSCSNTLPQQGTRSFPKLFQGNWIRTDYIKELNRTKSPFASESGLSGICSIHIDLRSESTDTLEAGISINNHEGGTLYIYNLPGIYKNSFPVSWTEYSDSGNFYEIGSAITGKDTSLVLYHFGKNKKTIDSLTYSRVASADGIDYITNKILFSGSYILYNTSGVSTDITFTDNGHVTPLFEGNNLYLIAADFNGGPEQFDYVSFGTGDSNLYKYNTDYTYSIHGDSIILSSTAEKEGEGLVPGPVKYVLKKK